MKHVLIFVAFLIMPGFLFPQDDPPPPDDFVFDLCPELVHCISGSQTYSHYIPWGDLSSPQVDNCGGVPWTQSNFKFEALSPEMEVIVTWDVPMLPEVDQFKCGIIEECGNSGVCVVGSDCEDDGDVSIYTDNLIVGHTYIFFVDGCNSTYEVDIEVEFNSGSQSEFISIDNISLSTETECDNGLSANKYCKNIPLYLKISGSNENEIEYLSEQVGFWNFTLDGPISQDLTVQSLEDLELNFELEGEYVLTLESVQFNCEEYFIYTDYYFDIVNVDEEFGIFEVCQHDLNAWTPGFEWRGPSMSQEGYYKFEYHDECGCPYYQDITVIQLNEVLEEVEIELCPEDYPYTYLEEVEIEYSQLDYENEHVIYRGSVQEDSYGHKCDTTVYLILINENPEERCSSCELPISLEKSKIVYCLPFDNGTFDVSGNANSVIPTGVAYDDNGSSNNRLWEAVFDGFEDYVTMPHSDDLNTASFSFDLQFNKDERFDNGPIETLISKGDAEKGNIRYRIDLEQTTADQFKVVSRFFTSNEELVLEIPDLNRLEWYGVSYVVEEDSLSMYLDGILHTQMELTESLKGNSEDLYLATLQDNEALTHYYEGRLDNFKYWKQKLSAQDILYLYYPEKEFEVYVDFFLNCCEEQFYEGINISVDNPRDTILIPEASPTGYDSVYILRLIPNNASPMVDDALIPSDIVVSQTKACNGTCSQEVHWNNPDPNVFSDLCGIKEITSSHDSPITLDESISYVEVVYTAESECGETSSFSFALELECEAEDFELIPEGNNFELSVDEVCTDSNINRYCINSELKLIPLFIDPTTNENSYDFSNLENLSFGFSINGEHHIYNYVDGQVAEFALSFDVSGTYQICYVGIESECEELDIQVCKTIEIYESQEIDYGSFIACVGNYAEVLPSDLSSELRSLIVNNPFETKYTLSIEDECGCIVKEKISIAESATDIPEQVIVELCEDDFPVEILGQSFNGETIYDQTIIVFENASMAVNSNGTSCDSLIELTIIKNENIEVELSQSICEGETYEGYEIEGNYIDVFSSAKGCDSIIILNLKVNPKYQDELFAEICPGEEFMGYTETGTYEEQYITSLGCDSTEIIHLEVLDEAHEDCFVSAAHDQNIRGIIIYPNPIREQLYIDIENAAETKDVEIEIFETSGKPIYKKKVNNNQVIDFRNFEPGLYIVLIQKANKQMTQKLLKI